MSSRNRAVLPYIVAVCIGFGFLVTHARTVAAALDVAPTAATSPAPAPSPISSKDASATCKGNFMASGLCNAGKVLGAAKDVVGGAAGAVVSGPGAAMNAASGNVVGAAADAAEASFTHWVADGAAWVLGQIAGFITAVSSPDITSEWFRTHYRVMWQVAVLFLVPFLLAAVMQAVVRQDPGMIAGAVARVPLAFLLAGMAVSLTALGLQATDELTSAVTGSVGQDTSAFLTNVGHMVVAGGDTSLVFIAIGSILTLLAGIAVYVELLLRTVVVDVALLFLPLGLAAIIWPATRKWAIRLAEVIAAAVMSKFLIASVLSLAVAAMSGQKGSTFPAVILGAVLLGMAAYAPYRFLRLMPLIEASAVHAVRGRGGAGLMERGYYNAQEVYRQVAREQSTRVAAFHARGRATAGLGPQAAGAGAATAVAGGAILAAGRVRKSASGTHDSLTQRPPQSGTGQPPAGSTGPTPPASPPSAPSGEPKPPKGGSNG